VESVTCASCGHVAPAAALICGVCGWSLDVLPTVALGPSVVDAVSTAPGLPEECPTCGQTLSAGEAACPICHTQRPSTERAPGAEIVAIQVALPGGLVVTIADGESASFGRAVDRADVSASLAPYDGVSRRHADIAFGQGQLEVSDLQSTNGTFVDDIQVHGAVRLAASRSMSIRLGRGAALTVSPIHHASRGNA